MICGKKRLFTKLQCISSTKILQKIQNGISPNIPVVAKMVRRLESDPLAEWMSVFCMYPEANFTIERVL
jgi:hypothetical protein